MFYRPLLLAMCLAYLPFPIGGGVATSAEIVPASSADKWQDRTVVLVFVGIECPVANGYVPEVRELQKTFDKHGIRWIAVHSEPGVTEASAKKHAAEYGIEIPLLLDSQQQLAAKVGAKVLGQVAVLQQGQVVYRGRIDDRFDARNGKRRDTPSTHELRDVLTVLTNGQEYPFKEVPAYGCPIPFEKQPGTEK